MLRFFFKGLALALIPLGLLGAAAPALGQSGYGYAPGQYDPYSAPSQYAAPTVPHTASRTPYGQDTASYSGTSNYQLVPGPRRLPPVPLQYASQYQSQYAPQHDYYAPQQQYAPPQQYAPRADYYSASRFQPAPQAPAYPDPTTGDPLFNGPPQSLTDVPPDFPGTQASPRSVEQLESEMGDRWNDMAKPMYGQCETGSCKTGGCGPCGTCCDPPCVRWTLTAGVLYMNRSDPDSNTLFSNPLTQDQELNADQFDFGFQPGYEVGITRHDLFGVCNLDLEARFWQMDTWTANALASIDSDPVQIHTGPPLFIRGPRAICSTYESDLMNLEVGLRYRSHVVPRWRWLVGFRALTLDEDLNSEFLNPGELRSYGYNVKTQNRLYGMQLGGDLDIWSGCCFCLRGFVRAGVFANEATNESHSDCRTFPECNIFAGETKTVPAFIGEAGLSLKYCICPNVALRADYRFMVVDGVALASEQFGDTSFLTFSGLNDNGQVFYQGAFVGVDWSF